ncbi:MAG: hypothetical protein ACYC7C_04155 [Coriobacteriia bacterium]
MAFLTPRRGQSLITLSSLPAVERFLEARDFEQHQTLGFKAEIHYIDLGMLVVWLREIIGDIELAGAVDEIVATERPFGLVIGDVKSLLAERVQQCGAVLGLFDTDEVGA